MRVAYRESIGSSPELEICLDKLIGGSSMYAKLLIRLESTLEDYDMTDIQKRRFESGEGGEAFQMSETSFNLATNDNKTAEFSNLAANQIVFDFEKLAPVSERIKLEGNEYDTGNKRQNK